MSFIFFFFNLALTYFTVDSLSQVTDLEEDKCEKLAYNIEIILNGTV